MSGLALRFRSLQCGRSRTARTANPADAHSHGGDPMRTTLPIFLLSAALLAACGQITAPLPDASRSLASDGLGKATSANTGKSTSALGRSLLSNAAQGSRAGS